MFIGSQTRSPDLETSEKLPTKPVGSLYAHIHNGGVILAIREQDGAPEVEIELSTFGHKAETTFYPHVESLREIGFLFLQGANHTFPSWSCVAAHTPCVPHYDYRGPDGSTKLDVKISEEELQHRIKLLRAELDRAETQLAQVQEVEIRNSGGTNFLGCSKFITKYEVPTP